MRKALLSAIALYRRALSPLLPPSCRYRPTCSRYASEAIAARGALSGGWLALRRIARCHPGRAGGYDPVPDRAHAPPRAARAPSPPEPPPHPKAS